jgi:acetyl esterase/lipase
MRRLVILPLLAVCSLHAQQPAETNVVFGTHSGLALLMDVYRPPTSNGFGIVVIPGSGWHMDLGYDARLLKESKEFLTHISKLNQAGYTTFVITHRAAPRFKFPAPVEDAQRAVRYVRHHASRYGIDRDRIGALGGSSGGHLVSMLGTLDGKGDSEDPDAVQRQSAKVQCVVALYPVTDPAKVDTPFGSVTVTAFMGMRAPRPNAPKSMPDAKLYWDASPVNHVTSDDPPFLLIHGDGDRTVPFNQSELMEAALKKAGILAKLVRVPGGGHGPTFAGATEKMDWPAMALDWFDTNLRKSATNR